MISKNRLTSKRQQTRQLLFSIGICISTVFSSHTAYADQKTFEKAVTVYMKGFKECVAAHGTRGESVEAAKRKFQTYLAYKDQAVAIDSRILITEERSMQKSLRYCDKAYEDILRAETAPIIKAGLKACDDAKTEFEAANFESAQMKIDLFDQKHIEALSITDGILGTYAIASKVRICNRLKYKISEASEIFYVQEQESQLAIAQLIDASNQCIAAHKAATRKKVSARDIDLIQRSISKSKRQIKTAKAYDVAVQAMKDYPDRDSSRQMSTLFKKTSSCTKTVDIALKRTQEKMIDPDVSIRNATRKVRKAHDHCLAGKSLVKGTLFQYDNLDVAWDYYRKAVNLRYAAQKQHGASLAIKQPKRKSSKQYHQMIAKTVACEKLVAEQYELRNTEYALMRQNLEDARTTPPPKLTPVPPPKKPQPKIATKQQNAFDEDEDDEDEDFFP